MRKIIVAGLLLLTQATASAYSGSDLMDACKGKATEDICNAYIRGSYDGLYTFDLYATHMGLYKESNLCIPDKATMYQVKQITMQYLEKNPHQLHIEASTLMLKSLTDAFPCKAK